jgi:hypothetical protein
MRKNSKKGERVPRSPSQAFRLFAWFTVKNHNIGHDDWPELELCKDISVTKLLADFLGTSANAVRWQVWTALLTYLLLRYVAFLSQWGHSFSRLFTVLRTSLWKKWNLLGLLRLYGTAEGHFRYLARPEQAFLPGMS